MPKTLLAFHGETKRVEGDNQSANETFEVGIKQTLYHKQLRKMREALNMSQPEFAEAVDMSLPLYRQIELLQRFPSEAQAEMIASYLDVDTRWLFPEWSASITDIARQYPREGSVTITPLMLASPEVLKLETEHSPEEAADRGILSERVAKFLEVINPRQQKIVRMRFGISPYEKTHTLEEVAQEFGCTRERVRQLEAKALKILEKHKEAEPMKTFILSPEQIAEREWIGDNRQTIERAFMKRYKTYGWPWELKWKELARECYRESIQTKKS